MSKQSQQTKPKIDIERNKLGKKIRREVVGAEYDDQLQNAESDFSQPIRDYTTENLWGRVWADNTLSRKTRSLLNIGLLAAFNRQHEFKLHVKRSFGNGVTKDEIKEVLLQIACYAGVPAGIEAFRWARDAMAEMEAENKK